MDIRITKIKKVLPILAIPFLLGAKCNIFNGGTSLSGASLGVTIRKDLFPVAKKRN